MDKENQDVFLETATSFGKVLEYLSPGVTPITGAVLVRDGTLVERLLNAGCSPNQGSSPKYGLPLEVACRVGMVDIAGMLVEGGAHVTEKEMSAAIDGGSLECIELLMSSYIAYCGPGAGSTEILFKAIESNHSGMLRVLLDSNLGYQGERISRALAGLQLPALGAAIRRDNPAMVQMLIDRGADIGGYVFIDQKKKPYLHYACEVAGAGVVRVLLSVGLGVNDEFAKNFPIHVVAERRTMTTGDVKQQADVIQVLLDWGADITTKNAQGRTLMQIVARSGLLRQLIASAKTASSVSAAIDGSDAEDGDGLPPARHPSGLGPL